MKKINLSIDGMTCSACSNGLERYLNKQKGILNATVNLVLANANIEYDEKALNQDKIEEFIKQAGFKSLGEFKEIKVEAKNKKDKTIFIIFSILAIILMYISMGHMLNLPTLDILNPLINPVNYAATLLILTIAFMIYGYDILKSGYKNLIHKTPNMNSLVSIGVISSFLYSLYSMYMIIKGSNNYTMSLYFESTAIVIYFIKLGRYIDGISKDKTNEAIQRLVKITPNITVIKVEGKERTVTLDEIHKGDIAVSRVGEKIAVDGEIVLGSAHFDESFITGESKPVLKKIGSKVIAGSLNYDGYIEYRAEKIGRESMISGIVRLVLEATNTKAPISKVADRISGYFVPVVMIIAIITFLGYLVAGESFEASLITFVTVLVVACPCSLGLATPLAIVVSEGLCASNGILVKKSEILENTQKVDTVVFDKTGTLTYGKMKISKIINYSNIEEKQLLQLVGSIENKSTHPIAKAFTDYLNENKLETLEVLDFKNLAGLGIIGTVSGEVIALGNLKMLNKYKVAQKHIDDAKRLTENGNSIVYVIKANSIIAMIGVNDIVRREAKTVIDQLSNSNIDVIMLTGDNDDTSSKIAKEIGIKKVIANVLPAEKVNVIKKLREENRFVMMCGDGINDSPALASSNVGVSINGGTDIAMDSSNVILTKNDLNGILNLISISKKTIRNIKQNLFWAFFYNCLMIPVAIGILKPIGISINPMLASLSMVFSSITVILNTLRLKNNFRGGV